jgi:peptidoglycan-associated lipoprotein
MRKTSYMLVALIAVLLALQFSASGCKPKPKPKPPIDITGDTQKKPKPGTQLPLQLPLEMSITVFPNPITIGQTTTLSWNSSNATGINIDNGIGTVEASGSRIISPRVSTTYKATATGADGSVKIAEVRVTVEEPKKEIDILTPKEKQPKEKEPKEEPKEPPPPIELKDIFFGYNQYDIRDDARTSLLANVRLLKDNPTVRITIEGHCDERGSEKYNLALGDRRAIAAKDFLTAQGIESDRIDTISFGKESPFCEDHNEECWQLNRRAFFKVR